MNKEHVFSREEKPKKLVTNHDGLIIEVVEHGAFNLVFQPIFAINQMCIEYFEAFVRFDADFEQETMMSVEETISRIEELELHDSFDFMVIKKCFAVLYQSRNEKEDRFQVAINLCPETLSNEYFPEQIAELLRLYEVSPADIILEITERTYLSTLASLCVIPRLRSIGFRLAIDDFISGYSNFSALTSEHTSIVKVDQTVVSSFSHSHIARRFAHGILNVIESLGKRAVFEGVETTEQYLHLSSFGCSFIQGYFISPPIDASCIGECQRELLTKQFPVVKII